TILAHVLSTEQLGEMKSSQRYATPPSPEALSAFTAPSSLSRPGGRLFLGRSNALEEEMVDVIAPVEPEPLLVRLERHPHLRRQTRVEEILDDHSCERGSGTAFSLGHRFELPGHGCWNPRGDKLQLCGRRLSHALLSSMQLARRARATTLAR